MTGKKDDRMVNLRWFLALGSLVGVVGCSGGPGSIAPVGLAPTDAAVVEGWIGRFQPHAARLYRIRPWRYRNERGSAAGRAVVRVAPPDSMRFDYQGPFRKSGKAAVVGDSALWVVPDDDFGGLVALAPVFWAAVGLPQAPPPGTPVFAMTRGEVRAWRYIVAGDTLNFVLRGNPATRLLAEIRRRGRTIGVADVRLDPVTGFAVKAKIDLPIEPSRFEFTVEHVDTLATFDPTIWLPN